MPSVPIKPKPSVIVGLSGGVDSAVAALLLQQQGYEVAGLFMKNWEEDDGTEYCSAEQDLTDAQQVADRLGIRLHRANFAAEYWDNVFSTFLAEYNRGRTPNPDVLCNSEIKFKQFADYASELGADFIATGHYARLVQDHDGPKLAKAADDNKDQSYFLQGVPKQRFANCLFPLGGLTKPNVRKLAAGAGFAVHQKKDSTGICFIGERRFADFLSRYVDSTPGPITDSAGVTLGQHAGLAYYTIGQRQGLAIGGLKDRPDSPWYVVTKVPAANQLIVTQNPDELAQHWLVATDFNWFLAPPDPTFKCHAKIRYRQRDAQCTVRQRADGAWWVEFVEPQRAITPGQYVCLYNGDLCIGGGVIQFGGPSRWPAV